jgi:hypothetical protein
MLSGQIGRAEYTWCLHCERVWPTSRWNARGFRCPTEDCDGSPLDAHS